MAPTKAKPASELKQIKPCAEGDGRPLRRLPHRAQIGHEVCLPDGYSSRVWMDGTDKQTDIMCSDFGLGYGKTCLWKTPWCEKKCYATTGRYDYQIEIQRRLTWVQNRISPEEWYATTVSLPKNSVIRIGRSGDVGDPIITERICQALVQRPDILFMWPTRSWTSTWSGAHKRPWEILQHYLPGKVLCSYDPKMGFHVPPNPATYILEEIDWMPHRGVDICPHYVDGRPCLECLMCFTTSSPNSDNPRSVAYYLHGTCKGTLDRKIRTMIPKSERGDAMTPTEWRTAVAKGEIIPADVKVRNIDRGSIPRIDLPSLQFNGLEGLGGRPKRGKYSPEESGYTADDVATDVCRDYDP